jgi:hypothetical protein
MSNLASSTRRDAHEKMGDVFAALKQRLDQRRREPG